jgi:hypothetical protein
VVVGALLLLAACAPAAKNGMAIAPSRDVYVTVENQNWLDVSIYALRGVSRTRIGQVSGNGSARLKIPSGVIVAGQVRLLADAIGSNEQFVTDVIAVDPDQGVQLMVAPSMRMSSYAVRRC